VIVQVDESGIDDPVRANVHCIARRCDRRAYRYDPTLVHEDFTVANDRIGGNDRAFQHDRVANVVGRRRSLGEGQGAYRYKNGSPKNRSMLFHID
jgi:hypothetical protein